MSPQFVGFLYKISLIVLTILLGFFTRMGFLRFRCSPTEHLSFYTVNCDFGAGNGAEFVMGCFPVKSMS